MPFKILIYKVIDEKPAKDMEEAEDILDKEYRIKGNICQKVRITNEEYDLLKKKGKEK